MNEQLQKQLSELIIKTTNNFESSFDFFTAEIPDVIGQLIMWYGIYNAILCLAGFMLLFAIIYGNIRHLRWLMEDDNFGDPILIFHVLQLFWVVPLSKTINLVWLQILIAPKVFMLEYACKIIQ